MNDSKTLKRLIDLDAYLKNYGLYKEFFKI